MNPELEQLAYPIGRFAAPESYTDSDLQQWISVIESCPAWYDAVIENMDEAQLRTPYRPDGWDSIQVIHHVADSHMNAYVRLKLALTEDTPTIKPYDEKAWAILPDVYEVPVNVSTTLIHALHRRWTAILRGMQAADWTKSYFHPEQKTEMPLWKMTAMYAWHCRHHFTQIRKLRTRRGW